MLLLCCVHGQSLSRILYTSIHNTYTVNAKHVLIVFVQASFLLYWLSLQGHAATSIRIWPFERRSNYTYRPSFVERPDDPKRTVSDRLSAYHRKCTILFVCLLLICRYSSMLISSHLGECFLRQYLQVYIYVCVECILLNSDLYYHTYFGNAQRATRISLSYIGFSSPVEIIL